MSESQLEGSTEQWENRAFGYGLSRYKSGHRYDGRHHAGQWLADSKRREALEDDGWAYIQVTAENLMNDFEERALAQRVADRMSQRLSKPIMLCQRMSSGRIHIRITSLANGSRKILI